MKPGNDFRITRRRALRDGAALALGAAISGRVGGLIAGGSTAAASVPPRFTTALPVPQVLTGSDIALTAQLADVQILSGPATRMWTFNGTFPGPTIRRPSGQATRVTLTNSLPADAGTLTLHLHGGHTPSIDDGRVEEPIARGASRLYTYPLQEDGGGERAALQWYHDHSHLRTARNAWMGLAGLFIVDDEFERALGLPSGPYELPLVVLDRQFDANNQLTDPFTAPKRGDLSPVEAIGQGFPPFDENVGNVWLVNGAPQPYVEVEPRAYRVRILNASNFRPFNFALSTGEALTQIGTESGLLPAPVERTEVLLGPAERADLVLDFSQRGGQRVVLKSVPRSDAGDKPHTGAAVADLLQFRVAAGAGPSFSVPSALRPLPAWAAELSPVPDRVWAFGLGTDDGGRVAWTINGRAFDHMRVDARPELGSTETWALVNSTPYGVSHYIHIHDVDFVVLSRNGQPPGPGEEGLKETFRIDPGEVVVIGAKFSDHVGRFYVHCHMIDHEDHGMMTNFEVVEPGQGDLASLPAAPSVPTRSAGAPARVALGGVAGRERACVEDILRQVGRRPGEPAAVRRSPGAGLGVPAGTPPHLLCHLPSS